MANTNPAAINDGVNSVIRDTVTQPTRAVDVVPNDTTQFAPSTLYIGGSGNIRVMTAGGDVVTFHGAPAGFFPVKVIRVLNTNTSATQIVRLFND
jgi:hypothetical protein